MPSKASRPLTLRTFPRRSNNFTVVLPTGFGLSGERVAKNPTSGLFGLCCMRILAGVPSLFARPIQYNMMRCENSSRLSSASVKRSSITISEMTFFQSWLVESLIPFLTKPIGLRIAEDFSKVVLNPLNPPLWGLFYRGDIPRQVFHPHSHPLPQGRGKFK